ncbi:MAG: polysaccharide deacetylase family protein [Actinomycetota bacterium]
MSFCESIGDIAPGKAIRTAAGQRYALIPATLFFVVLLFSGAAPWFSGAAGQAYAATPPRVALTFDDGYGLDHRILEFLTSQGIRATAFVVGSWAQRNPALVQEMNALGWDICNHTQNHAYLTKIPDPLVLAELNTCQAVIGNLTGQRWPFFRPPGGFIDDRVRAVAAAAGYIPVMWDMDSGDSRGVEFSVAERVAYMVSSARDRNILLFHFGGKHTYELVTGVVQGLKQRGFCFVTVPELYGWKNMTRGGDSFPGLTATSRRFLFAEGTTREGFAEWILVFNPGPVEVGLRLDLLSGEEVLRREYRVPPFRRLSINVNHELPGRDEVVAVLEATGEVVAERSVYFNRGSGFTGGFTAPGAVCPSRLHFFPEGVAYPRFEEYLVLFNPGPVDARTELELVGSSGSRLENVIVPPRRRVTLGLESLAPGEEYSLVVRSEVPLVAERSRYFVFDNLMTGASATGGEVQPRPEWFFAEGTTREGFHAFLSIYNPCREATWVSVRAEGGDGSVAEECFPLPAMGRRTVALDPLLPPGTDFVTRVHSLLPVVAERSTYFREGNAIGGASSPGIREPEERWYFAEGCTDGGFSEWLIIENPWSSDQEVEVIYYTENGNLARSYMLPGEGRFTVDVSAEVGHRREVSMEVRSSAGVIAERSLYFEADLGL